ncbi:hypothetical protein Taro_015292 [Colocasia esculenta]|uniref:Uncharacterized protein n=1 Tax=Colocasia esculenta TaxID=4460 RepID=A0A843UB55_COLES|nr:hypothetical protein [Colocasia esculenta]
MMLRQQLRKTCHPDDTAGQIDIDALFDGENPLQYWVEVREEIDDPVFKPTDTTWAEGILDEDEPRDSEFRVPTKRPRASPPSSKRKQPEIVEDTGEQSEFELARYSKSNSRSVTPRMVKPPPSLRTTSEIYMTQRASVVARDDPSIEKMKQIYLRGTPRGKRLHTKMHEMD